MGKQLQISSIAVEVCSVSVKVFLLVSLGLWFGVCGSVSNEVFVFLM